MTAEVLNVDGLSLLKTDSFITDTSIVSYKTEKSVNSRKSRYNALPRRKYADIRPPRVPLGLGSVSEDVNEDSVPKVCRISGSLATTTLPSLFRATWKPIQNLPVQRKGKTRKLAMRSPVLRSLSPIHSPDRSMACLRSSHHN